MLSFLCWQPGLLFVGTAFLIFSRYLTSWRDRRALKLLAGAAVPLAVTILYFHLRGALGAMYEWTLEFPLSVFALHRERTLAFALDHLLKVFSRVFQWDTALLALSLIGFVMFAAERLRARLKRRESLRSDGLFRDAILVPPVVYLAFCLVNMQGGPDLIPVFPFIGVFGGWFFVQTARFIESRRRGEAGAGAAIQGRCLAGRPRYRDRARRRGDPRDRRRRCSERPGAERRCTPRRSRHASISRNQAAGHRSLRARGRPQDRHRPPVLPVVVRHPDLLRAVDG